MYDILLGGQAVGKAAVSRRGLYYHFDCRCNFSGEVMYRIQVRCGEKTEDLGILVPENGEFTLKTKVPVKKLGETELEFQAVPKRVHLDGKFIPLSPEEPFQYLKRLQNGILEVRNGEVGVVFLDSPP